MIGESDKLDKNKEPEIDRRENLPEKSKNTDKLSRRKFLELSGGIAISFLAFLTGENFLNFFKEEKRLSEQEEYEIAGEYFNNFLEKNKPIPLSAETKETLLSMVYDLIPKKYNPDKDTFEAILNGQIDNDGRDILVGEIIDKLKNCFNLNRFTEKDESLNQNQKDLLRSMGDTVDKKYLIENIILLKFKQKLILPEIFQRLIVEDYKKAIKVQEIVNKKLTDISPRFSIKTDGLIGEKTLYYLRKLLTKSIFQNNFFYYGDKEQEEIIKILEKENLNIQKANFDNIDQGYYTEIKDRLSFIFDEKEEGYSKEPKEKESYIITIFQSEIGKLQTDSSEKEPKLKKALSLLLACMDAEVLLWEGSDSDTEGGNSFYPYQKNRKSDCTTYVYQLLENFFPEIKRNPKIQQLWADRQVQEYAQITKGSTKSKAMAFIKEDGIPKIIICGANSHMFLIYPTEIGYVVSEASGEKVRIRPLLEGVGSLEIIACNITTENAIKFLLNN